MVLARPESETQIARMFDKIAPRYDLLNSLLSMRQDRRWRRKLISLMPVRAGGQMLDVATGTGDVLLAAQKTRREYQGFAGVDISPEMLERAREKWQKEGLPCPPLQVMSAVQLGFPAASFDCVSISFGLRNVVDKDAAIAEFSRVLKPGGKLLILEFFTPDHTLLARGFLWYFHHILPKIGALLSDREAYQYLPQSVASFYDRPGLEAVLHAKGFATVEWHSFLFGSCRLVAATKA